MQEFKSSSLLVSTGFSTSGQTPLVQRSDSSHRFCTKSTINAAPDQLLAALTASPIGSPTWRHAQQGQFTYCPPVLRAKAQAAIDLLETGC